jgi:hypothetical protein
VAKYGNEFRGVKLHGFPDPPVKHQPRLESLRERFPFGNGQREPVDRSDPFRNPEPGGKWQANSLVKSS